MRVLFSSVEVAPLAKVGGLADVAGSLPQALAARGHDVRIVMPAYGMALDGAEQVLHDVPVRMNGGWTAKMNLWRSHLKGVETWLIGSPGTFENTRRSEEVYAYGRDTYLLFAQAILEACRDVNWIPDVIHANDWHTGFLPVLTREKGGKTFADTATVFTIHNLHYQGIFGPDTLDAAGLPSSLFHADRLETFGAVNFIKSACVYADRVNTVSPTYAREITTPEYGEGLWGLMGPMLEEGKLSGILNGIDYDFFNPAEDHHIAQNFTAEDLTGKAACKAALQRELGLPISPDAPLLGIVSRLSNQKGFDIILRQAYGMLAQGTQFVALGTGDPWAAQQLRALESEWPESVRFVERYDAPLAQRIYAGSDLFLMPSAFEPCGLGQMIACRYGTVPIARTTGGLADTIFEPENGFVFTEKSARQLFDTVGRALNAYQDKAKWTALVQRAMRHDFSWVQRSAEYEKMYGAAVADRRRQPATV